MTAAGSRGDPQPELRGVDLFERLRHARGGATGRLGPFEDVEEVRRGGQGVVLRAWDPMAHRAVALKRCLEEDNEEAHPSARFEREIEAACALSHPYIVTVYGIRRLEGGRVLVMEWVEGEALDLWSTRQGGGRVGVERRVEMALRLCEAVGHAHQRGVIHRDLKPANVLVDGEDRPRILDFGVAKFLDRRRDSVRPLTGQREFLGTLGYAAPECVLEGKSSAADARSDVFSLGVLLYEMLCGRLPWESHRDAIGLARSMRAEPLRPSTLCRDVDHELDAIVLRSIAHDPRARYESVAALHADLERYRAGEALEAVAGGPLYRVRKFVGRHRAAVLGAGLLILASAAFWGRARSLLAAARVQRAEAIELVRNASQGDLLSGRVWSQFGNSIYQADLDPHASTLPELLRVVVSADAEADPHLDPGRVAVQKDQALGQMALALHEFPLAERALERAEAAWRESGRSRAALAQCLRGLGQARLLRGDWDGAESAQREAMVLLTEILPATHAEHVEVELELLRTLRARHSVAEARRRAERLLDRTPSIAESVGIRVLRELAELDLLELDAEAAATRIAGGLDRARKLMLELHVADLLGTRARVHLFYGDYEAMSEDLRQRVTLLEGHRGIHHPATLDAQVAFGSSLLTLGRLDQALPRIEQAVEDMARYAASGLPGLMDAKLALASARAQNGEHEQAIELAGEVADELLDTKREFPTHSHITSLTNAGTVLAQAGQMEEGRLLVEVAVSLLDEGGDYPVDLEAHARNSLAQMLRAEGRLKEALEVTDAMVERAGQHGPEGHTCLVVLLLNRGTLRVKMDDLVGAREDYERGLELGRRSLGVHHYDTLGHGWGLARLLMAEGELEQAEGILREGLSALRSRQGSTDAAVIAARLAYCLLRQERIDEAVELLHEARAGFADREGPRARSTLDAEALLKVLESGDVPEAFPDSVLRIKRAI